MTNRRYKIAGFLSLSVVSALVVWLLHRELHGVHYHQVLAAVSALPGRQLALAAFFACCGYGVLTFYDYFGLRYAEHSLPFRATAPAAFISYAFSNNIGLGIFGGLAFRYRLYSGLGLSTLEITKVVFFCAVTFWLGLLGLGGFLWTEFPPPALPFLPLPPAAYRAIGLIFLILCGGYVLLCYRIGGKSIQVRKWTFTIPKLTLSVTQIAISSLDWLCASSVLYLVLPASMNVPYFDFLSLYVLANVIGLVSHVPGGIGVLETVFLVGLSGRVPSEDLLASLLVFRGIYYFAPLGLAVLLFGFLEAARQSGKIRSLRTTAQSWMPVVVPRVFAVATFAAGIVLLFSGVTPQIRERTRILEAILPLPLIEGSHLLASLTGLALLMIARGLQKRLDGAYVASLALLGLGAIVSLVKGLDYEEAAVLSLIFMSLLPCRRHFYRHASLLSARFSPGWVAAIVCTLGSSLWLMIFAHKHVDYSQELWWTFTFKGDAPRALRASFAVISSAFIGGFAYLFRVAKAPQQSGSAIIESDVRQIVANATKTYANLALLGDKILLVHAHKNAFLMYGVQGKSWIAMGDPLGPADERMELIWQYRDLCDRHDVYSVFYQVDAENLQCYVEAGLALVKIGEEAIVRLPDFSLEGKTHKGLRATNNKLIKDGYEFEVVPKTEIEKILGEMATISCQWMGEKHVKEKRFSLGYFSDEYLRNFAVAVVRRDGEIVAFANIWETASKEELSIDLMRHGANAPNGVMDFLFLRIMLWGKSLGYGTFNLGMAPFSGMENRRFTPLSNRLGAAVYQYGEYFYNFQGLREYKEKFHPEWNAKFVASPAGLAFPVVLSNIATLISGGFKGIVSK